MYLPRSLALAAAVAGLTVTGAASVPAVAAAPPRPPHRATTELIQDCGNAHYLFALRDLTLDPAFPEPGKPLRWRLSGTLRKPVDLRKVTMHLTGKVGEITIIDSTERLPDFLRMLGARPPSSLNAPAGPLRLSGTVNVPRQTPQGDYQVSMQGVTGDNADFTCLKGHFDFTKHQ